VRLLSLDLVAFGPFDGQTVELARERGVVNVVYGGNEAGKSTSLRALEALFFGMEHTTTDAHRHPSPALRVGGVIESADGTTVKLVRRKGRKDTLRDGADLPVDEARMRGLLSGVDRELFRALWGLDHVRLRDGARAIFSGKGGVGETLFEAGLAGAGAARLAVTLKDEADGIWSARATTKPLVEALKTMTEQRRLARRDGTTFEGYKGQLEGIERAKHEKETFEAELLAMDVERRRLERVRRVQGPLAELAELVRERAALGDVRLLPEDATTERVRAEADLAQVAATLAEVEAKLADLAARRASLGDVEPLPFEPAEVQSEVSTALGQVRAHRERAGTLSIERAGLLSDARTDGIEVSDEALRRVVASVRARGAAIRDLEATRLGVREAEAWLDAVEKNAASVAEPAPVAPVERELAAAARLVDRREELRAVVERARFARARAESAFMGLGLFDGTLAELAGRRAPAEEEVASDQREIERAGRELAEAEVDARRLSARVAELERDLGALLAEGDVPTEADLALARRVRDSAIDEALGDGAHANRARAEVARADALSDRLRREASRVTRFAVVSADLEATRAAAGRATGRVETARAELARREETARARFVAIGVRALDPASMREWLRRRAAIVGDLAVAEDGERVASEHAAKEREVAGRLASAQGAAPASLDASISAAERSLSLGAELRRRRDQSSAAVADAEARLARVRGELAERTDRLADARARAEAELRALGLAPDTDEDALLVVVEERRRARAARAALTRIDAELEAGRDAETRLGEIARRVARALALAVDVEDPVAMAERVGAELRREQQRREAARALELEEAGQIERREAAHAARARGRAILAEQLARAGVADPSELPAAELKSARVRALAARLSEVEAALRAAGDGAPVAELEAEAAGIDAHEVVSKLDALDERRAEATRLRDEALHQEISCRMGLDRFEESKAAEHAGRAEVARARALGLAARFVRLRLASVVLEREMEAYRRAVQDPLLVRAGELFVKLTSGGFDGLGVRVDDRDKPELVCLRGGREVDAEGLSDGTRDQLYLALRLATIERHARHADPLPLVLDDVLVHFDDVRSGTALELFAEVARSVQVILFTHHRRIVELATERLGERAHVVTLRNH
jgi:uncharacterized protein YhaN